MVFGLDASDIWTYFKRGFLITAIMLVLGYICTLPLSFSIATLFTSGFAILLAPIALLVILVLILAQGYVSSLIVDKVG